MNKKKEEEKKKCSQPPLLDQSLPPALPRIHLTHIFMIWVRWKYIKCIHSLNDHNTKIYYNT